MRRMSSTWEPAAWPSARSDRPRVVIENDDGGEVWADERTLSDAGYDVATCGGPSEHNGRPCPLITTGTCALVAGADVVLNAMRLGEPQSRAVIAALTARYPDTPVIVEVDSQELVRYGPTLTGCHTVPFPMTSSDLVREASAALGVQV